MTPLPAVELSELTKSFSVRRARNGSLLGRIKDLVAPVSEHVLAIDRVSLSIQPGERVAFIGPNGAGKSTTIKVLSGILRPDAGQARVMGLTPWRDRQALGFRIGTVFGQRSQLWYHLPARDTFELLGRVYELDRAEQRRRVAELSEAFELGPYLDKPVSQLSLGERMRAEVAASLLHRPQVLFLDEPTIGLDVTAKAVMRSLLQRQSEQDGSTLLLTSHDTGDIERVCQRVVVIHGGRLVWDGSIANLRRGYLSSKRVRLWSERERLCLSLPGVRVVSEAPYQCELEVQVGATPIGVVVDAALKQGALRDVTIEDAPLDEVIQAFYAQQASRIAS
ncbi:MAG TPA: ATP-binding cassette domain-containing protein [Polyangiaceae bacterium]|nr:ATP-binding cassette domain-containing protein [Polyangiaceae bacterium]